MRTLRPASRELLVAFVVFALAVAGLSVARTQMRPHYRLAPSGVIASVRAQPAIARFLAKHHSTSARVLPYDSQVQGVSFFAGSGLGKQIIFYADVNPRGKILASQAHTEGNPQQGAPLANTAWMLTLMTALFLLAVAVVPLWRLRNLDALALAGFTANIAAVNAGMISLSVLVSLPLLVYLGLRCLAVAVGPRSQPQQVPLYEWLTSRWEPPERVRVTSLLTAAALAATLVITLTSVYVSAVATASLTGATDLLHWTLPYGHIPYVLHGDTYPLLNYVLYLPGAALTPVTNPFSNVTGALPIAAAGTVLTAAALWVLARRRLGCEHVASLRVVLAWAVFPPVLVTASGGNDDLLLAAILAWMLVLLGSSSRSLLALTAAAWTKVVPIVLLPLWLVREPRARWREVIPAALLSIALCGYLVVLGGAGAVGTMFADIWFPFHRGSLYAPWYAFSVEWLQPVVQAAVVGLLAWVLLRLRRERSIWRDTARISGIFAVLLLGVQLGANQWTFTYLAWAYPFIVFALLVDPGPARAASSEPPGELPAALATGAHKQLQPA